MVHKHSYFLNIFLLFYLDNLPASPQMSLTPKYKLSVFSVHMLAAHKTGISMDHTHKKTVLLSSVT